MFDEDRLNGTPAAINSTASRSLSVDVAGGIGGGLVAMRGFGGTQGYVQTFSTVNATRSAETLNRIQRVPTEVIGFGAQWVQPLDRHALLFGAETRHITVDNSTDPPTVWAPYARSNKVARFQFRAVERTPSASAR